VILFYNSAELREYVDRGAEMKFRLGHLYTRDEIHDAVGGGNKQWYLPCKDERVLCACLDRDELNPNAPHEVLVGGPSSIIEGTAEILLKQGGSIPVFIKRAVNEWEYAGHWQVRKDQASSRDPAVLSQNNAQAQRTDVVMVVYLEPAAEPTDNTKATGKRTGFPCPSPRRS
jgi:hypothetical protein